MAEALIEKILTFWFGTTDLVEPVDYREAWFKRTDEFDSEIRSAFASDNETGTYDPQAYREADRRLLHIYARDQRGRDTHRFLL